MLSLQGTIWRKGIYGSHEEKNRKTKVHIALGYKYSLMKATTSLHCLFPENMVPVAHQVTLGTDQTRWKVQAGLPEPLGARWSIAGLLEYNLGAAIL